MTQGDSPSTVGMVSLNVASINELNVDKNMARVIAIPGYYLCAETYADAVDWLMSMVFNCQTAIYATPREERHLAPLMQTKFQAWRAIARAGKRRWRSAENVLREPFGTLDRTRSVS